MSKTANHKRLSSNTLFHFTASEGNLINILTNDFSPRICIEKLTPFTRSEIAIPMVCFCDIPLSQTGLHSHQYGSYGIGLSKDWGKRHGISPVMYFHSNANHIGPFIKSMRNNQNGKINPKDYSKIMYTTLFYKPYEGKMWRGTSYTKNRIRFYDEKEWRYIPKFEEFEREYDRPWSFYDDEIKRIKTDPNFKSEINTGLAETFKLKFHPADIKYLIVKNESEIISLIDEVRQLKEKFGEDDIKLLCSRIISMESIRNDF